MAEAAIAGLFDEPEPDGAPPIDGLFEDPPAVKSAAPEPIDLSDSSSPNGQSEPQFIDGLFGGGAALQPEPLELEAPFEAAASMATGLPNMVAGTAAGAWETLKTGDPKAFDPAREEAMASGPLEAITYEPRSKGGKQVISLVGTVFQGLSEGLTDLAQTEEDLMGPGSGAPIKIAGELLPFVLGAKGKGNKVAPEVKPVPEAPPKTPGPTLNASIDQAKAEAIANHKAKVDAAKPVFSPEELAAKLQEPEAPKQSPHRGANALPLGIHIDIRNQAKAQLDKGVPNRTVIEKLHKDQSYIPYYLLEDIVADVSTERGVPWEPLRAPETPRAAEAPAAVEPQPVAGAPPPGEIPPPGETPRVAQDQPTLDPFPGDQPALEPFPGKPRAPEEQPPLEPFPEGSPAAEPKAESGIRNAAGNINLDYIRRPQHVQEIIKEAANDIPLERVSNAETIRAAQDLGLTERQLLSRRGQQALNPQQLIAARDLLVSSADRVSEMAKTVVGGSDESVLAFKQALDRHTAIQAQVSGATALAGRALQSFRIGVSTPKALKNALNDLGGKASIEDIAQAINDIGEPGQVGNFLQQVGKGGVRRGLVEFWINSILSGPKTHAANVIGNSFTSLLQIPEEAVAAGLQATRAFGKGGEKLTQRGVGARAYGLLSGINDGIRAAGIALKSEGAETAISKAENTPAIPGKFGKTVRISGRLLGAEDAFFKTVNYRAELSSQAANAAKAEGLSGKQLNARIGEILDHPTDDMLTAATRHADMQTFTNAGGPFVRALQQLKSKVPEVSYILPFIRTPTNLLKFALARTPAAALMPSTYAEWASGSAGRARVASRVLTGTTLQTWLYTLATDGTITGHGPESRAEKESLMASGWRPYSVKVGEEYVSYQRGDPMSYIVGMVADAQNLVEVKGKKNLAHAALGALTESLADKTFFKGIANLSTAIEYKQPEKVLENIAGGFIPSALNEVRKQVDPMYRETDGLQETLMNRVPGLSSKLEPKRDVLGAPMQIDPSIGPDFISPASVSKISTDPVRQLLGQGVSIGKPSKRIQGKGLPPGGIDLDTKEYSWLVKRQGETAEKLLNRIVRNPKFRALETDQQQTIVDKVFDATRRPFRTALQIKKVREKKQ